jgi:hypothetical protein
VLLRRNRITPLSICCHSGCQLFPATSNSLRTEGKTSRSLRIFARDFPMSRFQIECSSSPSSFQKDSSCPEDVIGQRRLTLVPYGERPQGAWKRARLRIKIQIVIQSTTLSNTLSIKKRRHPYILIGSFVEHALSSISYDVFGAQIKLG